jgi:hypothetical protein
MVKAHQDEGNGKQLDFLIRGDVRQGLSLNRLRIPQGKGKEKLVQVPESGKPDAGKLARPVWNGGKAARSYLSLREVQVDDYAYLWLQAQADTVEKGAEGRIVTCFRHALATVSDAGKFTEIGQQEVSRHRSSKNTRPFSFPCRQLPCTQGYRKVGRP